MVKLPGGLRHVIIGLLIYFTVSRLFPEDDTPPNPTKDLRGGEDIIKNRILKMIMNKRALKMAIFSIFASYSFDQFNKEIETLLVDDVYNKVCVKNVAGDLKLVCDIIKEHELELHTKSMRSLIIANNISNPHKIKLLKIKLNFIINGECSGRTRFVLVAIVSLVITLTISGVGGLALILDTLTELLNEGKISKALYNQILKALKKKYFTIPYVNATELNLS